MANKQKPNPADGDVLTLKEVLQIVEPDALTDQTRYNTNKKKMNEWAKKGWIRKYGANQFSASSLVKFLVRKKLENITSGSEKITDKDVEKYKALTFKCQADRENALADIYERVQIREEHIFDYIHNLFKITSTELCRRTPYQLPPTLYGMSSEKREAEIRRVILMALQTNVIDKLNWGVFLKEIDELEGDRD